MSGKRKRREWHRRHVGDAYVKQATQSGYRSRAAYKLRQLDDAERLLAAGALVVDLGAAPGGWSQVARERVGSRGRVIAVDRLEMAPIDGVEVVLGDFRDDAVRERLEATIGAAGADLVISDMAPNLTGVRIADQAAAEALVLDAFAFAEQVLKPGGRVVVKVFQGSAFDTLLGNARQRFDRVRVKKPAASRAESSELYLLGTGRGGILTQ